MSDRVDALPDGYTVGPVGDEHREAAQALNEEAFGVVHETAPPDVGDVTPRPAPGMHRFGMFFSDAAAFSDAATGDQLVAYVRTLDLASHVGAAELDTCGVASVVVAAEHQGRGLLRPLLTTALLAARRRGAVLASLFPTAPGIYRGLGFELVGAEQHVELPVAGLAALRRPVGVTVRRAVAADVPAIQELYATWARTRTGALTRTGPRHQRTEQEFLDRHTGVSLAVGPDGEPRGYVEWLRNADYGRHVRMDVGDLIATDDAAATALWRVLGSFTAVAGTVRVRTSGVDPALLALPFDTGPAVAAHPYMWRLLDVRSAITGRRYPHAAGLTTTFAVRGDRLGAADPADGVDGAYRVEIDGDGRASCDRLDAADPDGSDLPTFTVSGLSGAYAGVWRCADLRVSGRLEGDQGSDAALDALFTAPPVGIRDYF